MNGKGSNEPNVNEYINADPVRFVDATGEMQGVVPLATALASARASGMDLVEVSPMAEPPVCKVLDYGKHRFESQKKMRESKHKQKVIQLKEIKLRQNIGEHDYQVKMRASIKFINRGDKVKVTLRFRGREITHKDLAENLFERFKDELAEIAKIELEPKMEGRQLVMVLTPVGAN
jgi:translation initiation factor IF-3